MLGQAAHLVGDHRKATPTFPGTGGLDGGVEREQVGLRGDAANSPGHLADGLRVGVQLLEQVVGSHRLLVHAGDLLHQIGELFDAVLQFGAGLLAGLPRRCGQSRDLNDAHIQLLDRCGGDGGRLALCLCIVCHLGGAVLQLLRGVRDFIQTLLQQLLFALL